MDEETSNTMNIDQNHGSSQEQENTNVVNEMDIVDQTTEDGRYAEARTSETNNSSIKDEKPERNWGSCEDESFYDCSICLHLAKDPVVTNCGHLFCWSCLYRWFNHRSGNTKCPICKGEVKVKNVIPVYGRGHSPEVGGDSKIPARPPARNVESLIEAIERTGHTWPWANIARCLRNRSDLTPDSVYQREIGNSSETSYRALDSITTSRGPQSELQAELPIEHEEDLMQRGDVSGSEIEEDLVADSLDYRSPRRRRLD